MRVRPSLRRLPIGGARAASARRFLLRGLPAHRARRRHRLQGSACLSVRICTQAPLFTRAYTPNCSPMRSHQPLCHPLLLYRGPPVLRPLRDRRAAQATAVHSLRRPVPRRAHCQSGRTRCHCGDGRAVPLAVRVGGAAGGIGRALGAVPAGAHPVPRRRGALPCRLDARSGGRSLLAMVEPLAGHCLSLERPRWLCFRWR